MARFSFRGVVYALVVMLGLLSAAPNILPHFAKQYLPQWYTTQSLTLGLDLQGGSHLLLGADTNALQTKQLNSFSNDLFNAMRENNIRYTKHSGAVFNDKQTVAFTLQKAGDASTVKRLAYELSLQPSGKSALDINIDGGKRVNVKLDETYVQQLVRDALNRSVEVVRKRLNETGLTEPSVTLHGNDAILVQMPGVSDPSEVKLLLGTTAQMQFHWQVNDAHVPSMTKQDAKGNTYQLEQRVALEGEHIVDAAGVLSNQTGQPVVSFKLDSVGAKKFANMTRDNIGRVLAIVLDDTVVTAPVINSVIPGGRGEISGNFTLPEAG
ncbi:MAG: protein translocase subunit SecDF, partial [Pseudomonadota bacterium]|nr:protein translocase subunit SecDF [Pseudomonadota bacterium]